MAKKKSQNDDSRVQWIVDALAAYADGVHYLASPCILIGPPGLSAVFAAFDGGELFHASLVIFPKSEHQEVELAEGTMLRVAEYSGDEVFVDSGGQVFRLDADMSELIPEAQSFSRWLAGVIDAESLLYEHDGEFREEVFDDEGELTPDIVIARERCHLKRDPKATGPKWRLSRALADLGKLPQALDHLEAVVSGQPKFAWAWYDMARISERMGKCESASEEAQMAADTGTEHVGFFLGHAARLAEAAGDTTRAQELASRVVKLDPQLPNRHRDGARKLIESGDIDGAKDLLLVAKVVAPRDLETIDLLRQIAEKQAPLN